MVDYNIYFDAKNSIFIIESESIVEGSIAINIPDSSKYKKQFISLFLHKADVEEGLDFLHCISLDKHVQVNKALFISALTNMMKCFQSSSVCNMLSEERFMKAYPHESKELDRFKNWRNKHFVHDENSMREASAFLFIAPEESENILGGFPSVIWNRAPIDFLQEGRKLELFMQALWKFIVTEIDKVGQIIMNEYSTKSRDELMSYGNTSIKLASIKDCHKTRDSTVQQ